MTGIENETQNMIKHAFRGDVDYFKANFSEKEVLSALTLSRNDVLSSSFRALILACDFNDVISWFSAFSEESKVALFSFVMTPLFVKGVKSSPTFMMWAQFNPESVEAFASWSNTINIDAEVIKQVLDYNSSSDFPVFLTELFKNSVNSKEIETFAQLIKSFSQMQGLPKYKWDMDYFFENRIIPMEEVIDPIFKRGAVEVLQVLLQNNLINKEGSSFSFLSIAALGNNDVSVSAYFADSFDIQNYTINLDGWDMAKFPCSSYKTTATLTHQFKNKKRESLILTKNTLLKYIHDDLENTLYIEEGRDGQKESTFLMSDSWKNWITSLWEKGRLEQVSANEKNQKPISKTRRL